MNKLTTCKYCGRPNLAWTKSKRTGRWYLSRVDRAGGMAAYGPFGGVYDTGGLFVTGRPHTREECNKDKTRTQEYWNELYGNWDLVPFAD